MNKGFKIAGIIALAIVIIMIIIWVVKYSQTYGIPREVLINYGEGKGYQKLYISPLGKYMIEDTTIYKEGIKPTVSEITRKEYLTMIDTTKKIKEELKLEGIVVTGI